MYFVAGLIKYSANTLRNNNLSLLKGTVFITFLPVDDINRAYPCNIVTDSTTPLFLIDNTKYLMYKIFVVYIPPFTIYILSSRKTNESERWWSTLAGRSHRKG